MIHFFLVINQQGKIRLAKWYSPYSSKDRNRIIRDLEILVLKRTKNECNFVQHQDKILVYRKYASVYFIMAIDEDDNELLALETIHRFCIVLDKFHGRVCELDLIFYFEVNYTLLDELILAGELQETSVIEIERQIHLQIASVKVEMLEEIGIGDY